MLGMHLLDSIIWWTGALAWFLCGTAGLLVAGLWILDFIIKQFGLYTMFKRAVQLYYTQQSEKASSEFHRQAAEQQASTPEHGDV